MGINRRKVAGFVLIEVVWAVLLTSIILSLFGFSMHVFQTTQQRQRERTHQQATEWFLYQLVHYPQLAHLIQVSSTTINFGHYTQLKGPGQWGLNRQYHQVKWVEQRNHDLILSGSGRGAYFLLRELATVKFTSPDNQLLKMEVVFQDGIKIHAQTWFPLRDPTTRVGHGDDT